MTYTPSTTTPDLEAAYLLIDDDLIDFGNTLSSPIQSPAHEFDAYSEQGPEEAKRITEAAKKM